MREANIRREVRQNLAILARSARRHRCTCGTSDRYAGARFAYLSMMDERTYTQSTRIERALARLRYGKVVVDA